MGRTRWVGRAVALAEVVAVFAAAHVALRALRRFTELGRAEAAAGLSLSPGLVLIAAAAVAVALHRRRPVEFGLTARPFFPSLHAGVLAFAALLVCGMTALAAGVPLGCPVGGPGEALGISAVNIAAAALTLWTLRRIGPRIERLPRVAGAVLLAAGAVGLAWTAAQAPPMSRSLLAVGSAVLLAGVGEEVFFRGYVQSRLNEVFGRPWRLLGVRFGPGLLVAAGLFGMLYALAGVDAPGGGWKFGWWAGLAMAASLYYGFLRERFGSVAAPAVTHVCWELLLRVPGSVG